MKIYIILLLGLISFFSCNRSRPQVIATFQLDMSKYQDEIIDPNSVGVIGYPPLLSRQKHLPMTWDSTRGIYTLSLKIPDSLIGKPLAYSYVVDSTIRDSPGYSWREIYLPKKSKTIPVDFFNEFVGSTGENIKPSPPIKVVRANTPAEELSLSEEFIGITSDGSAVENLYSIKKTGVETKSIVEAVSQYIEELTADQKKISLFPVDSDEWRKWHNIEFYERQGLGIFEMNEKQKELAFNILKTSLSARGFEKSKNIMAMEGYLKRLVIEQRQIPQRRIDLLGDDKFYFTIMGRPSESEPWGWQLDGHHLVINYFVLGDQVVMTPVFMGSEPNYIEDGPNSGIKTFEEEEEKGLALYRSLKGEQRERATLWSKKEYQFNQAEAFNDNQVIPFKGLRCTDLTTEQTDLLKSLIQEYIGNMKPGHAKIKMAEIEQHMDNTWFSWVGGSSENDVFYYRIHSPVILIEFDHHSPVFLWDRDKLHPGPVHWHIHTVVRTPNGNDYGKDLLKQHLQNHPH